MTEPWMQECPRGEYKRCDPHRIQKFHSQSWPKRAKPFIVTGGKNGAVTTVSPVSHKNMRCLQSQTRESMALGGYYWNGTFLALTGQ